MFKPHLIRTIISATAVIAFALIPTMVLAADSSGYEPIGEFKSFDTHMAIIFASGQTHSCGSFSDHFRINETDAGFERMERTLHAAFLAGRPVQVKYNCVSSLAIIQGVRVR